MCKQCGNDYDSESFPQDDNQCPYCYGTGNINCDEASYDYCSSCQQCSEWTALKAEHERKQYYEHLAMCQRKNEL